MSKSFHWYYPLNICISGNMQRNEKYITAVLLFICMSSGLYIFRFDIGSDTISQKVISSFDARYGSRNYSYLISQITLGQFEFESWSLNVNSGVIKPEEEINITQYESHGCDNCSSYINIFNFGQFNETHNFDDRFKCVNLSVIPPTPICVYSAEVDIYVSRQILNEGVWEPHIVRQFQDVLRAHPTSGVIDLGANIGQYSLIAAQMGHQVVAIEPHLPNLLRLAHAAKLGGSYERITILQNGISDTCGFSHVIPNNDNQGDTRLRTVFDNSKHLKLNHDQSMAKMIDFSCIDMINFQQAVVKVDIQGYEQKAFKTFQMLLKRVNVSHIFMEWVMARELYVTKDHTSLDKTDVINMIWFLTSKGYKAFSAVSGKELNNIYWYGWPEDIIWK